MRRRIEHNLLAAGVPLAALAISATAQLLVAQEGGSLAQRLGWPAWAAMLTWQISLLGMVFLAAAVIDAGLVRRDAARLREHAGLVLASCLLVTLDLAAWGLRLVLGVPLSRAHLAFLLSDMDKITVVTTGGERALLVAVPVAGVLLGAGLAWAGHSLALRRQPGRNRALLAVCVGLATTAVAHGTTLLNRAEVLDLQAGRWTTVGANYRFLLGNNGLWFPQLVLARDSAGELDASLRENRPYVRTGPPVETVTTWASRVDRARFRQLNVVLVQVDSVRYNELVPTGGDPRTMPNLSRIAARSLFYDRCYAPTSETAYSLPAMLDGQYALRRSSRDYHDDLDYPAVALAELLRAVGYRTAIFSSHNLAWQRMDRVIRPEQYDEFCVIPALPARLEKGGAPAWLQRLEATSDVASRVRSDLEHGREFDTVGLELLTSWLQAQKGHPFFAVLAEIGAHYPYRWPEALDVPFTPFERSRYASFFTYPLEAVPVMYNAYRDALFGDDVVLGELFATLQRLGLAESTLVVIASDHGQSFGDHGLVTHARGPYESQIRTPLVFTGAGLPAQRHDEPVSSVDIPPTILGILHLPGYGAFQGWNLLDPATPRDRPIYFSMQSPMTKQECVVAFGMKYIEDFATGRLHLFDLRKDPEELHDLVGVPAAVEVGTALQSDLRAWHMSQLVYYATPELRRRFFPPRYPAIWSPRAGPR